MMSTHEGATKIRTQIIESHLRYNIDIDCWLNPKKRLYWWVGFQGTRAMMLKATRAKIWSWCPTLVQTSFPTSATGCQGLHHGVGSTIEATASATSSRIFSRKCQCKIDLSQYGDRSHWLILNATPRNPLSMKNLSLMTRSGWSSIGWPF